MLSHIENYGRFPYGFLYRDLKQGIGTGFYILLIYKHINVINVS